VLAQLLVAMAFGASLHAVGQRESIATLLVVITMASIIGGAVPVPGGLGVVESGPDRRADQRWRAPGSSRRGRVHPAAVHRVPATDLGLGNPRLDAPTRIRVTGHLARGGPHQLGG
jgi:hypothetical protein